MEWDAAAARAVAWLENQGQEMERLLGQLVTVNSHTPETAGVNRVGDLLGECFTMPGLDHQAHQAAGAGTHHVWGTAAAGKPVLLVGHHDTVFPPGTFEGMRQDGPLLRGPGVLDMKGGLVVVNFALRALAHAGALDRVALRVVSVSDEEVGSPTGRAVLQQLCAGARSALVFEAGRAHDAIITRRKGTGGMTVTATGRAAHAGNQHAEGINAIWALALFIDAAQQLTDHDNGITVNVGTITGGSSKNTVPDHARCQLDFRFLTMAQGRQVEQALAQAAHNAQQRVAGARIELEGGISRMPLERTDASAELMHQYAAAAAQCGLGRTESALLGGGSDANTASAAGVPAIDGLGPRGKGFHTLDEQIERATLVPKAMALVRFLVASGAQP